MNIAVTFPENPFSTTSGAARSVRTICEILGAAGHNVYTGGTIDIANNRSRMPFDATECDRSARYISFRYRNVSYRLGPTFDLGDKPRAVDIAFGYGGDPTTLRWFESAQHAGLRTIFALRNYGYEGAGGHTSFKCMSDFLTPSEFLSNWYFERWSKNANPSSRWGCMRKEDRDFTALPVPINFEDCILPNGQGGKFGGPVVMVNPSPGKGLMFMARLWQRLQSERPDIPLRIVMGRADVDVWLAACRSAGFNPYYLSMNTRVHRSGYAPIEILGPKATPLDIYRGAGCLLMPSLWDEPAGRVAVEAMLNGVPVIHSGRGGLEEATCDDDGQPSAIWEGIDPSITPSQMSPVAAPYTNGWFQSICSLYRNGFIMKADTPWQHYSYFQRFAAISVYGPNSPLALRYLEFFEKGRS